MPEAVAVRLNDWSSLLKILKLIPAAQIPAIVVEVPEVELPLSFREYTGIAIKASLTGEATDVITQSLVILVTLAAVIFTSILVVFWRALARESFLLSTTSPDTFELPCR
jgi:hypothetical protein